MDWDEVKAEIRGLAVLVMVPFKRDLSLHLEALKQHIRYMCDAGLTKGRGFLICPCGTGDLVHLNVEEHRQVVETAIMATDGELPVVPGVAATDYRLAIELAINARKAGAKCVMIPPPYYYRLDEEAICEWYRLLAEAVPDVAIMVYDQSMRTEVNSIITLPIMERLARLPNVVSLKYGSPRLYYDTITALEKWSKRFAFIDNSNGFMATEAYIHGAAGFITGPAAFCPKFELRYWELLEAGKYQEAGKYHYRLVPFILLATPATRFFFAAVHRVGLEYVGLYGGPSRPPFRELTPEEKEEVFAVLDQIKVVERNAALTTSRA